MARSTIPFVLHVDRSSDPISGSLVYPDGRRREFAGWIELTAALEEARHFEPLDVVAHANQASADADAESRADEAEDSAENERP